MVVGKTWRGVSRQVVFICVVTILTSFGCGSGPPPQGPSAAKPGASKNPGPSVQTPAMDNKTEGSAIPPPPYAYNPEGRRDPFRSILVKSELGKSLENLPALLRTEVGELRLIGIVWGGFGYSAMVQTPDGKGYTIHVGTPLGPNRGRVQKITERYLTIEERYVDIFGENKVREVKLDLHPQKEGSE
ncbi:MAG: pilus assembly protein PilP [Nitrospirae bacterium]|nr:pilus assembly protein PilP [Nitrospirota bacterium]